MRFKLWLEIVEPYSPKGIRAKRFVKHADTVQAQPIVQFQWKTRLGNVVKVQFEEKGDDTYNIVFYVNNTLYDDAGKVEGQRRDAEILSGVFDIVRRKADQLGAKKLTFRAHASDGDVKVVRGLEESPRAEVALQEISKLESVLRSYKSKTVPPSPAKIALFQKLGKPLPQSELDFDVSPWLKFTADVKSIIEDPSRQNGGYALQKYIDLIKNAAYSGRFSVTGYDPRNLIFALENLSNAQMSNSQTGWRRNVNRRASVYNRLVNRYFNNDWAVSIDGDSFEMVRSAL